MLPLGRLLDFIGQGIITLKNLDILFWMSRQNARYGLCSRCKAYFKVSAGEKTKSFPFRNNAQRDTKLASEILVNPVKVEVAPVSSTAETIDQSVFFVEKEDKINLLIHLLQDQSLSPVIVFSRTKHGADKIAKNLINQNFC